MPKSIAAASALIAVAALCTLLVATFSRPAVAHTGWSLVGEPCRGAKTVSISATEDVLGVACSNNKVFAFYIH